jgi:small-conductance mechanosensitive channel
MKHFAFILILLASPALAEDGPTTRELLSIINERSSANSQRFEAQEKAVAAALAAAKEAVAKAETAAEKRFDSVNEFRASLKDQQTTLIPRVEVDVRFKAMEAKVSDNEARINQIVSRAEGSAQLWQGITAILAICLAIFMAVMAVMSFRKRTVGR